MYLLYMILYSTSLEYSMETKCLEWKCHPTIVCSTTFFFFFLRTDPQGLQSLIPDVRNIFHHTMLKWIREIIHPNHLSIQHCTLISHIIHAHVVLSPSVLDTGLYKKTKLTDGHHEAKDDSCSLNHFKGVDNTYDIPFYNYTLESYPKYKQAPSTMY